MAHPRFTFAPPLTAAQFTSNPAPAIENPQFTFTTPLTPDRPTRTPQSAAVQVERSGASANPVRTRAEAQALYRARNQGAERAKARGRMQTLRLSCKADQEQEAGQLRRQLSSERLRARCVYITLLEPL
jgi:hypothetical protein